MLPARLVRRPALTELARAQYAHPLPLPLSVPPPAHPHPGRRLGTPGGAHAPAPHVYELAAVAAEYSQQFARGAGAGGQWQTSAAGGSWQSGLAGAHLYT